MADEDVGESPPATGTLCRHPFYYVLDGILWLFDLQDYHRSLGYPRTTYRGGEQSKRMGSKLSYVLHF